MAPAAARRVLVVGAGIGGLAAAAALAQRGVEVEVVELRPQVELAAQGVGLGQSANALRALRSIGVLEEILDKGFILDRIKLFDDTGRFVTEHVFDLGAHDGLPPYCSLPRSDLHQALVDTARDAGVAIRVGDTIGELDQEPDRVMVRFEGGHEDAFDVVAGFDGVRSKVRRMLFGDRYEPTYTGYAAWRVAARRPDSVTSMENYSSIGGKAALLPMNQELMYLSHIRAEPAGVYYEPDRLVEMLRERLAGYVSVPGQVRDELTEDSSVVYSPLEVTEVPAPWFTGRVVIGGDAAHAGPPHLTQGAAMALEDAVVLAQELASDAPVPEALKAYEGRRVERCHYVQQKSVDILRTEQADPAMPTNEAAKARLAEAFRERLQEADAELDRPVLEER